MKAASCRRGLAALLLLAAGCQVQAACDAPLPVATALRTVTQAGTATAAPVALPDRLPLALRGETTRLRYRVDTRACAGHAAAAIWLFRVGAPYTIRDAAGRPLPTLDGAGQLPAEGLLGQAQVAAPVHNGRLPALFGLPPGTGSVEIELLAMPYIPSGVVRAQLGPTNLMLPVQVAARDRVVAFSDAAAGIVLVLGLLAFLLWTQRRGDGGLLWLSLACGLWGVRGVVTYGPLLPAGWPPALYEQFNPLNVLAASACLAASMLWLLGAFTPARRRALAWVAGVAIGALLLSLVAGRGGGAARALALTIAFGLVCLLMAAVWQRRAFLLRGHAAILLGALAGLVLCAIHDLLIIVGVMPLDSSSLVFWGFVVVLVGFAAMSGQYVVMTLNRAERSNAELERHARERERLLRDMHDGLGGQLVTVLRGVERNALGRQQLTQSLQDSLDELRLLMDSTDMGHYLPGALATWRSRWDHRLQAAGVTLDWRIGEGLDEVTLDGEATLQVMRILQEAATNIVKHAQARRMVLDAGVAQHCLRIVVRDDGVGLPAAAPRAGARGLRNMQARATQIGARLETRRAAGGGTEVLLELPLDRAVQATSPRLAASIAASARDEIPSLR